MTTRKKTTTARGRLAGLRSALRSSHGTANSRNIPINGIRMNPTHSSEPPRYLSVWNSHRKGQSGRATYVGSVASAGPVIAGMNVALSHTSAVRTPA